MEFKTEWQNGEIVKAEDLNRIEGNIEELFHNSTDLEKNKLAKPTQKSLTIPNTGWTAETNGPYTQKLVLAVEGITVNTIVNVTIALASEEVAQDCGLASTNESGNGTITFYAESVPSAAIQATYYTMETGGGA
ncbi:MAG: hypothetical protein KH020_07305 [Clostridiales bacterium]|nr:hypothetical protein [Clostridiales bacterium]